MRVGGIYQATNSMIGAKPSTASIRGYVVTTCSLFSNVLMLMREVCIALVSIRQVDIAIAVCFICAVA